MSPTFVKEGVDSTGMAIKGVAREFVFPYTTEDPDEIKSLLENGATVKSATKVAEVATGDLIPPKREAKEDKGGEQ